MSGIRRPLLHGDSEVRKCGRAVCGGLENSQPDPSQKLPVALEGARAQEWVEQPVQLDQWHTRG